jgi:hypothetical protein
LTYLALAFPNQKIWQNEQGLEEIVTVWHNILYVFPVEAARRAVENYNRQGEQFFPSLSVVAGLCDDAWRRQIENQHSENLQCERDAAKLLFHAPLDTFVKGYPQKAVALIRRVCDGEIKFMSEEWKREFKAIFPDYDPQSGVRTGAG